MNWIFFALLAPAVFSVVNFTDKYIVEKEVKNYNGMPIYQTLMGLIIGTLFWIINGYPVLSIRDASIVIFTGILTV